MSGLVTRVADTAGAAWEKRGNTVWLECPECRGFWPVSPGLLRHDAPVVHCPRCHHEFHAAAGAALR